MSQKKTLFELTNLDRKIYREKISPFLPESLVDIHTHVWPVRFKKTLSQVSRSVTWPDRIAKIHPISHLQSTYQLMFPDKKVTPLLFSPVPSFRNLKLLNSYVAKIARRTGFPSLIFSSPWWSGEQLEENIVKGKFLGAKSYLSLAPRELKPEEIRIYDFFPPNQLEVLNQHGWILMLHLPRPGRLKDLVNLQCLVEIDQRYPKMKTIVAHVGRAYCNEDVGSSFNFLKGTKNLYFDISANTNEWVFTQLIKAVGPERILFGSDLPVTRMRTRRICEQGRYVNLVPKGLYGDVSGDPHLKEVTGEQAASLTFFLYEEILSFLQAAKRVGLSRKEIRAVFHDNAASILNRVKSGDSYQLQMVWCPGKIFLPDVQLPSGYRLRTFRLRDAASYIRLLRRAGFTRWKSLPAVLERALPGGIFLVEDKRSHLVATACALHHPTKFHPEGGELGWVAVDPAHRGKGLGQAVCQAAIRRFLQAGYRRIYLLTDDWRWPAIKIYFRLGFQPFCYQPGMKERWRKIADQLKIPFTI
ncbi:MAG: GNAT family N-acetyltransferase [Candidatus Omnitrophica bacterium]|nr:GNAT family N-acetyltransferase [Candidatus Omnitrophota bacterium]